jgi:hypothetical protein
MANPNTRKFILPLTISPATGAVLLIVCSVLMILSSCSPVRSGNPKRELPIEEKEIVVMDTLETVEDVGDIWGIEEEMLGSGTNAPKTIAKDTHIVILDPIIYKYEDSNDTRATDQQLEDISKLLDNGMTEQACTLADGLYSSLEDSEAKWHALFYVAECRIAKNQLDDAKAILAEILKSKARKEGREKALIRMGQIECLDGNKTAANEYYIQLRTDYPKSIYLPLAVCQ